MHLLPVPKWKSCSSFRLELYFRIYARRSGQNNALANIITLCLIWLHCVCSASSWQPPWHISSLPSWPGRRDGHHPSSRNVDEHCSILHKTNAPNWYVQFFRLGDHHPCDIPKKAHTHTHTHTHSHTHTHVFKSFYCTQAWWPPSLQMQRPRFPPKLLLDRYMHAFVVGELCGIRNQRGSYSLINVGWFIL